MAIHKLGSQEYLTKCFDLLLWKTELQDSVLPEIGRIVYDFYPPISRVTSLSENKAFTWFYGKVQVSGEGEVQVRYPYSDSSRDILTIKNVSFGSYPYIVLAAVPEEGWEFDGWYDLSLGNKLSGNPTEILSDSKWVDITSFEARFVET